MLEFVRIVRAGAARSRSHKLDRLAQITIPEDSQMDQQGSAHEASAASASTTSRDAFADGAGVSPRENGAAILGPGAGILTLIVNGRAVQAMADPGTTLA